MILTNEDIQRFHDEKIKYWVESYGFTEKQAELVYSEAYERYHSIWSDMVNCCDSVADFAEEILKAK